MKILAIEFSSDHRSVAVLDGGQLLAEQTVTNGRETAAVALIESALGQAKVERSAIECIAVGIGPGSYTGIRAAIALRSAIPASRTFSTNAMKLGYRLMPSSSRGRVQVRDRGRG